MDDKKNGAIYWTAAELAKPLLVTRATILRLIGQGRIKAVRLGRQYRIPASEAERILAEGVVMDDAA